MPYTITAITIAMMVETILFVNLDNNKYEPYANAPITKAEINGLINTEVLTAEEFKDEIVNWIN